MWNTNEADKSLTMNTITQCTPLGGGKLTQTGVMILD